MIKKTNPLPKTISVANVTGAAVFGALVGGTAAAAKGIRQVKTGRATKEEAALDVAREAGSTAVAAGAATAVVGALGLGSFLSILGIAAVATGTKYAMDSLLPPAKPAPAKAPAAPAKKAAPKTAAKKSATKKTAAKRKTTKKSTAKKATAPKTTAKAGPETDKQ